MYRNAAVAIITKLDRKLKNETILRQHELVLPDEYLLSLVILSFSTSRTLSK